MGTYYSMFWPDAEDRKGDRFAGSGDPDYQAWQQHVTLSARYDIFDFWSVKLEGHYINGTGDLPSSADNPVNTLKEDWFFGAVKTSVMF